MKLTVLAVLTVFACQAQSFEVASIKPSDPTSARFGSRGGPGAGRFDCDGCTIAQLIVTAYGLRRHQLPQATTLGTDRFAVSAKGPPGTTQGEFMRMQQNLLKERFGLVAHWEKKEMGVYDLIVRKNGPKMKAIQQGSQSQADSLDARPSLNGSIIGNGEIQERATNFTMELLASWLSGQLVIPVSDSTGLKGKYDFTFSYSLRATNGRGVSPPSGLNDGPAELESGLPLATAIQAQLGLKLEQKKGMVDILVIDHVERVPTEN